MDVLIYQMVGILSQCIHLSNHYDKHLKKFIMPQFTEIKNICQLL